MSRYDALALASSQELDLVEVSPPYDPSGNTALIGANYGFEASSFFVDEGNRPRIGQLFIVRRICDSSSKRAGILPLCSHSRIAHASVPRASSSQRSACISGTGSLLDDAAAFSVSRAS